MYVGVDIGGSKTLLAVLNDKGEIVERLKFLTPDTYSSFLSELRRASGTLTHQDFKAGAAGAPGKIDRNRGIVLGFGNLDWKDVTLEADLEKIFGCPIVIENDANLAGLSEAMLLPDYPKVLYVTISTGIGTGIIFKQAIDPSLADSEGGQMLLQYAGKLATWESFASGKAIVKRYGKQAHEIKDAETWRHIARDLSQGFIELIAIAQPDVIVIGGSVGTYFAHYKEALEKELEKFENPVVSIPPLRQAARPEEAVIYGCYDLARQIYGYAN